jgi:hypothetical protein
MNQEKLNRAKQLKDDINVIENSIVIIEKTVECFPKNEGFYELTIHGPFGNALIPKSIRWKVLKTTKNQLKTKLKELKDDFERL